MDDALVPPHVERLVAYTPGKPLEELERELGIKKAIKLASNESPFGASPHAVEAMRAAAAQPNIYPDGAAFALRRALAEHLDVPMEDLILGNGSNELIDMIVRTFCRTEDHVVFGDPSFVCYWLACTACNVPFTRVPLRDHVAYDVDDLLAAVTPQTKVLFLANPNNPTGAYVGRDELVRLLTALPERVIAVIDEAYFEFPDAADYESALAMRGLRDRLIVLRTFSKAYGLAALRVGYGIAPATLIGYLNRVRAPFNVNAVAQAAARAALTDAAHVEEYVAMNAKERIRVADALAGLGLKVAPSQANFLLVDAARPGAEVYDQLLRLGVIVRPMPAPIDTWLRVTMGLPEQNDRFLEAVRTVLEG